METATLTALLMLAAAPQATHDLGGGFRDHGVATPISNHRGTVATVDGQGRDVVLSWVMDHRGCYGLLVVDAETGKSQTLPIPFDWSGDSPFASILSSKGRYYSHYGNHFVEYDPVAGKFSFHHQTVPQMAMSMTEDDRGRIWSATYPNSGVACYDPATGAFRDYGHLYQQNWRQYPRSVAADDAGWLYFGIGSTNAQVVALDPESGKATPLLAEAERRQGSGTVVRDRNGKVYAEAPADDGKKLWLELYRGERKTLTEAPTIKAKPYIAGSQGLFHTAFASGRVLKELNLVDRVLVTLDPKTKQPHQVAIDYATEGAHVMSVATAPNGTICGGTAFPMRFFGYDPRRDSWARHPAFLQFNTVGASADRFYFGGYGHGFLLEWDPTKPWVDTVKGDPKGNPLWLAETEPDINRPHHLLVHPDGKWIVLAGTPGYGYTGGGLLFWDRQAKQATVVKHTEILPQHSTMAMVALPGGKLLGGTTVAAGTGGEQKATVAELYLMDLETHRVEWHAPVLPGVNSYYDLWLAPNGKVYGVADAKRFFSFDPVKRVLLKEDDTTATVGPSSGGQGPRIFVPTGDGRVYLVYQQGVVQLDPETGKLTLAAKSPQPLIIGGAWLDGRVYFVCGSHVCSWEAPR